MTIDEAIKHCEEVAEKMNDCECAEDHRQLAEWLTELKESRKLIDTLVKVYGIISKIPLSDSFKHIQYLRKCEEDKNSKK